MATLSSIWNNIRRNISKIMLPLHLQLRLKREVSKFSVKHMKQVILRLKRSFLNLLSRKIIYTGAQSVRRRSLIELKWDYIWKLIWQGFLMIVPLVAKTSGSKILWIDIYLTSIIKFNGFRLKKSLEQHEQRNHTDTSNVIFFQVKGFVESSC